MKKTYCTQNNGDCETCSLVNYGLDCQNNPVQMPRRTGYSAFERYAISQEIHNGPRTLEALNDLYQQHKGSRWATIVELFKVRGELLSLKEYCAEMGYNI